jgi:hypothetical protein
MATMLMVTGLMPATSRKTRLSGAEDEESRSIETALTAIAAIAT